jgi:hypothetical protein
MRTDVYILAGEIGERNTGRPEALREAQSYITGRFEQMGYCPVLEEYIADGIGVANIVVDLPGSSRQDEIIVVGAHYDSAPGTQGANDNASSIAALLELASRFSERKLIRSLRFVAFVNEEPPFSWTELMGSRIHAAAARRRGEKITAMLCLECLGVYYTIPGSQQYPPPLERIYPDTADFIAFCSNIPSYPLLRKCIKEFRATTAFPSEGIVAPERLKGISWSDHWSFWCEGYRAIMITDTAFFRYKGYHTPLDTPVKLDYPRMARVVGGIENIILKLAAKV